MKNVTITSYCPVGKPNDNTIKIMDSSNTEFKNVTFKGVSYNTVMTGQTCKPGKYIESALFENCTFDETCRHISIWFAAWKDNAVLTIRNCKFKTCEQFLCLSDFHGDAGESQFNNKLTVNIENCVIENYEKGTVENPDAYEGIILCDSRKTTASNFETLNPFGDGKVTINIVNTKVGNDLLTIDNFKMGTKGPGQMLYLYRASGSKNYDFNEDTQNLFPTIIVDGQTMVFGSGGGMIEEEGDL